jgi:hypothetical protein
MRERGGKGKGERRESVETSSLEREEGERRESERENEKAISHSEKAISLEETFVIQHNIQQL